MTVPPLTRLSSWISTREPGFSPSEVAIALAVADAGGCAEEAAELAAVCEGAEGAGDVSAGALVVGAGAGDGAGLAEVGGVAGAGGGGETCAAGGGAGGGDNTLVFSFLRPLHQYKLSKPPLLHSNS